jgi:hypothetical protein
MISEHSSICLYHNGNSQVIQQYRTKFSHLKFCGNWAEANKILPTGCLWEISFADATRQNLIRASDSGIAILRHISNYEDDMQHRLPECQWFNYQDWFKHAVIRNLIFSDIVVSDMVLNESESNETVIINTGRTANTHFQKVLESYGHASYECSKVVDNRMLRSKSAVVMWREDHWETLASIWIALQLDLWGHQNKNSPDLVYTEVVDAIDPLWMETDWTNICQSVGDHAVFFKYVLKKPITLMTTERATQEYASKYKKIPYNKDQIICNYEQTKSKYQSSEIANFINFLYNKIQQHINILTHPSNLL